MNTPTTLPTVIETDEAIKLALKMARAAGKVKPETMARACYVLICTAALTGEPEAYIDWCDAVEKREKETT